MSTVDGLAHITEATVSEDIIVLHSEQNGSFPFSNTEKNRKLLSLIPFDLLYCYDCREQRYIHLSVQL